MVASCCLAMVLTIGEVTDAVAAVFVGECPVVVAVAAAVCLLVASGLLGAAVAATLIAGTRVRYGSEAG